MNTPEKRHYHLSYEKISSFERCPRRYFFSYLLRAPADFTPYFLYLGKIVHQCIAYVEETNRPFEPYLLDLLSTLEFQQEEETKKVHELSVSLMLMWSYWQRQRKGERVKFVERFFEILTRRNTLFQGRIDRVAYDQSKEEWIITDYKTGKSKISQKKVAGNLQTGCYALALSKMFQEIRRVKVELVYLRDSDTRSAYIETSELGQFEEIIDEVYGKIRGTTSYPAKRGWFCKMCRFADLCQSAKRKYHKLIPYLKVVAESEQKDKRIEAIRSLAGDYEDGLINTLVFSLLHDNEARVRKEAAYALGKLADEWALARLVKQVPSSPFPDEAHLALGLIADKCSRFGGAPTGASS